MDSRSASGALAERIRRIVVPVDLSPASSVAFEHALKLAVQTGAELEVIHVQRRPRAVDWQSRLGLESTLEAWGISVAPVAVAPGAPPQTSSLDLPPGTANVQPERTPGLSIKTTTLKHANPPEALTEYLTVHPADMVVLGSHGRRGIERLFARSVALPVAASAKTTALFLPVGAGGFVDSRDGSLSLRRVIVPIDHSPPVVPALEALSRILQAFRVPFVSCTFVHVGSPEKAPVIPTSAYPWTCLTLYRRGDTVYEILKAAAETSADLLVMSTAERNPGESLKRGTMARVIRDAPCPVLTVPANHAEPTR